MLSVVARRGRIPALLAVTAMAVVGLAPVADAASVTSAVFSGGAGTYTAANGTVYAKQGAALTLTVQADSSTSCVRVTGATGSVDQSRTGTGPFVFSTGLPELTAGPGNGLVQLVSVVGFKNINGRDHCTANQGETFTGQPSYILDNTAPTATAALTPAPNAGGWNKSNVTITWTGLDTGGSGVASVVPATDTVTADGTVSRTTVVTDNLGNSATSAPVTVNVDKTAPTITGSRTPAANVNGWNNTDVTVSFVANDATSGIKSTTGATTLTGNGANQSVTGTATDNADNSSSATVGGINIDKVAPTLSGTPTTTPNAGGWYNGDVTIAWTAADALSGTSNPANSTIGGEGTALTASATAVDKAGNSVTAQSQAVKIDRTAPITTVTAPPAWNKSDVTLTLVASDALSGVATTFYQLDGGAQTAGKSVPVSAEGNHTLKFWSTDVAGNVETAHTVSFGIDKTSPTIGHTQSPAANGDGWNNTDVLVTFSCSDALSGVASCTGPQTMGAEGAAQLVTGKVTDNAGNTATDPVHVSIDKTKPVITVDPLPQPDGYGWYGTGVTATYTATDALSGVKSQDSAHTFGEGANQTDTATATDAAGNSASVTTPVVNVDTTPPTITGKVVGTPSPSGWFSGDVTVHWTCADNLSGVVACPADSVVSGEGGNLSASASVSDRAGHLATATVGGINIDRTAPTTSVTGVPSGWVNAPVTVSLLATDSLSQVANTYYSVDGASTPTVGTTVTVGTQGVHTVQYWSVDTVGNAELRQSFTVSIDLSSPSITPSQSPTRNSHGWNNTDVTVSFACADQTDLSGLASCTTSQTVSTEGAGQQVTGSASDNAGNVATTSASVNIDTTPPTITGTADRIPNAAGWYNAGVTVSFTGTDPLSGIDTISGPSHLGEGADQSVTGTAVDNAGNTANATVGGINIDTTAPDLSAAPTTSPNGNGWYNTDVVESWTAADHLSGLAGPTPADSVLNSEGDSVTASASISDVAGNTTNATSAPVKIDKTAPLTSVDVPGTWVNSSVTVTLKPFDALSGVATTYYSVDTGPTQTGTKVDLATQGIHHVYYYSVDQAGNVEATHEVVVKIDTTAPSITHAVSPTPNDRGWNNSDVTVTFTCGDDLSGVASCSPAQTLTHDVTGAHVDGTATDNAGNTATDQVTVNLDKTPPTITSARTPAANSAGWNNTPVTVHFDGTDNLGGSGIDTVTPDQVVGEGTAQSVTGTAVDVAGNTASTTVGDVNVDSTAPALSGSPTTPANANGWYNGDVTIRWVASDDRSGVAATPANSTVSGEGSSLTATATVFDNAGNFTKSDSVPVSIDRTPPVTSADAPAGWNNSAVTVSFSAADGLSGLDATYYTVDGGAAKTGPTVTIGSEGIHTLAYWSVDKAGNVEPAQHAVVQIDLTKPTLDHTITPTPNAKGWNNGPVTVSYACTDALSGVASCPPDTQVTSDGQGLDVSANAVDVAGNVQTDHATVNIDSVKPTITASADRAANGHGWYAGDVAVSFACTDALSGIASCTSPVTIGEGAAQAAHGSATDTAGNTSAATLSPINVDETAPTLSGAPTSGPNGAGWYNGDVTIRWTAADALSGLDGLSPADSVITSEGTGLQASTSVSDLAGNQTTAASVPVKIDRTAPSTTLSNISDWSNTSVVVKLSATDNLSGVAGTYYQLDGAATQEGTAVSIGSEGVHTLQVWSVDTAGNVEAAKNAVVKIDRTAPGITHTLTPLPNGKGWNNTDVTVTFTCTDALSGVASCTAPVTKGEGAAQQVQGTAVDTAGNLATDNATVNVDKTKPTVTGSLSAAPNANGWFNSPVTATFTCADQAGLSGILSCPASQTLAEGRGQSAGGTATDAAGNVSDPFILSGINVDTTAPTLTGSATTAPNANGWYKGDVSVKWTASDALSGLDGAAPANSTVTGEGSDLSASASVSDKAGNTTDVTLSGLRIDRTSPTTTATAPNGWQSSDVTVKLAATDNLSGIAGTYYSLDGGSAQSGSTLTVTTEGTHHVSYWSVDGAGNLESPSSVTVLVDKTKPTITGAATTSPNASGWYNSAVRVHFDCYDAVSGIASCQPDATVSAQGANSVPGTAVDNAGNSASVTVNGINIDTVPPTVSIGGIASGGRYVVGAVPTPRVSASDATSGLAGAVTTTLVGGTSSGVGTFTYSATAVDRAGNVSTAQVTYSVVYGYGSTLFLQPVSDTAHQTGVATSVFNAGQTIPMKFQLRNASGTVIQASAAPTWLTPVKGGPMTAAVNESAYATPGVASATYVWDGTQYQYNWKTDKTMAGSYWRVGVSLDDGQTYYVTIGLR